MSYWECKSCTALTKAEVGACWKCGLARGTDVTVSQDMPAQPAVSERRVARLGHALPSFLVFALVGPVVGLFAFILEQGTGRWSVFEVVVPFGLIGAYAIGGFPAALAGLLYSLSSVALVFVVPRLVVSGFVGALLGACLAPLAILASVHLFISVPAVREMRFGDGVPLAAVASAVCGAISGWLFPVGRVPGMRTS